jgi:hypothetical protein
LTVIVQPSRLPRPDDTSVAAMTPSMRSAHGCCGNTPTRLDWTRHSRDLFAAYLAAKQRQHVAGGEWWPASPAALSPLPTSRRRPSGNLPAALSDSGDRTTFRSHASENIIAVGNSGTGKSHIGLGLGLAACQKGLSVGFTTAAALAMARFLSS